MDEEQKRRLENRNYDFISNARIRQMLANNERHIETDAMAFSAPGTAFEEKLQYQGNSVSIIHPSPSTSTNAPNVPKEDTPQPPDQPPTEVVINKRALSKHARTYELEKFKKNAMIIFNHENLEGFSKRTGTDKDVEALTETFSKFNFEIVEHKDLTKVDLFKELKNFSETNFTDYGCVAVVILTHGTGNGLLRAMDVGQLYSETDIVNQFKASNKPYLITKPVLLLIQACRGKESTKGVPALAQYRIGTDHEDEPQSYYLPVESDMLVVHSSYAGKPSYRPNSGSWFIQTLCKRIKEHYLHFDLETIVTEVKREVAIDKYYMEYNPVSAEMDVNKQMPVLTSTLIRKLFLRKYGDAPPVLMHKILTTVNSTETDGVDQQESNLNSFSSEIQNECSCFMLHFHYMKDCLRHYAIDNPSDSVARGLLALADYDEVDREKAKTTLITISNFLQKQSLNSNYYKYLHFYCETNETDSLYDLQTNENQSQMKNIVNSWAKLSKNNAVRGLGICIGTYVIYNFLRNK